MTIFKGYYEQDNWNLSLFNEAAEKEPEKFIKHVEQAFEKQINETVDYIIKKQPECKILMIAGPSSSGKTTVANMIKTELSKKNIWSIVISLDDFYIGIDKLPTLKNGSRDFESINGLDISQINMNSVRHSSSFIFMLHKLIEPVFGDGFKCTLSIVVSDSDDSHIIHSLCASFQILGICAHLHIVEEILLCYLATLYNLFQVAF